MVVSAVSKELDIERDKDSALGKDVKGRNRKTSISNTVRGSSGKASSERTNTLITGQAAIRPCKLFSTAIVSHVNSIDHGGLKDGVCDQRTRREVLSR